MDIRPLDPARYAGWQFTARYVTGSYLDISPSESGFALTRRPIAPPAEKSFTDRLFGSWLEAPAAFGAFDGQRLAAIAFYRSCGFAVIGFDLYSYSNDDPARREVRLEMGLKL